jgi:hypothetical protein
MSHDIIVKQHGGSIDVETEPGQFTEFSSEAEDGRKRIPRLQNDPLQTSDTRLKMEELLASELI